MIQEYRFSINGHSVNPIYSDDITSDESMQSDQMFFRTTIGGKITLVKDDYDWLKSQLFDTEFMILIERYVTSWETFYVGKFTKPDCSWDDDSKNATLKIHPTDGYDEILNNLDKEAVLVDLASTIERIKYLIRPVLQVYIAGADTVSCYSGSSYWEIDVSATTAELDLQAMQFHRSPLFEEINASGFCVPDVTGGYLNPESVPNIFHNEGQVYKIVRAFNGLSQAQYTCSRVSDNVALFQSNWVGVLEDIDIRLSPISVEASGYIDIWVRSLVFFSRLILSPETFDGDPTYLIGQTVEDILPINKNHKRCIAFQCDDYIVGNTTTSVEPTKHGRNDKRRYFTEPVQSGSVFRPLMKGTWLDISYWLNITELAITNFDASGTDTVTLKDAYPIHSIIDELLKKFVPTLSFSNSSAYSEFLYGVNNPISYQKFELLMTPKTNMFSSSYEVAAKKGLITLSAVLDLLRTMYKCYWHIENSMLRIEHISWYENGGTYFGLPLIGLDMTAEYNQKNNKSIGFAQNQYTYDKSAIPQIMNFKWMDDVSDVFEGYPIEVLNTYAKSGNKEDLRVQNFTSDVDYIIANYKDVSEDGFIIMACITNNINPSISDPDSLVNPTNGVVEPSVTHDTTAFINVQGGEQYTLSYKHNIAWYDENFVFISGSSYLDTNVVQIAPADARYLKCSYLNSNSNFTVTPGLVKYELPFVERVFDGITVRIQNGYLSWITLHPIYHLYSAPGSLLKVNNSNTNAVTVKRMKIQNVEFPYDALDRSKLIKTLIGNGFIEKISLNLSSRNVKVTLKHETQ